MPEKLEKRVEIYPRYLTEKYASDFVTLDENWNVFVDWVAIIGARPTDTGIFKNETLANVLRDLASANILSITPGGNYSVLVGENLVNPCMIYGGLSADDSSAKPETLYFTRLSDAQQYKDEMHKRNPHQLIILTPNPEASSA